MLSFLCLSDSYYLKTHTYTHHTYATLHPQPPIGAVTVGLLGSGRETPHCLTPPSTSKKGVHRILRTANSDADAVVCATDTSRNMSPLDPFEPGAPAASRVSG